MKKIGVKMALVSILFFLPFSFCAGNQKPPTQKVKKAASIKKNSLFTLPKIGAQLFGVGVVTLLGVVALHYMIQNGTDSISDSYKNYPLVAMAIHSFLSALFSFYTYLFVEEGLSSYIDAQSGLLWWIDKVGSAGISWLLAAFWTTLSYAFLIQKMDDSYLILVMGGVGGIQPFLGWMLYKFIDVFFL